MRREEAEGEFITQKQEHEEYEDTHTDTHT